MAEDGTMHIGELAEQAGMSLRTLRHYDDIGLLRPSGRSEGGFRIYTADDRDRLLLIRRMKPLGYSLEQMGDLLAAIDASGAAGKAGEEAARALGDFLEDAQQRRDRLARQLEMADEFVGLLAERRAR